MTTQLNGETFATYATQEQHELVKWAADAHLASSHSLNAATALSEACALRYGTLTYNATHLCDMITERRERAIKELLKALEIIGYAP